MGDDILSDLVAQIRQAPVSRPQTDRTLGIVLGEVAPSPVLGSPAVPGQKVHHQDAHYVTDGPKPFVCGTCSYAQVNPEGDLDCWLVWGPHVHGTVNPQDTCVWWKTEPPNTEGSGDGLLVDPGDAVEPAGDDAMGPGGEA